VKEGWVLSQGLHTKQHRHIEAWRQLIFEAKIAEYAGILQVQMCRYSHLAYLRGVEVQAPISFLQSASALFFPGLITVNSRSRVTIRYASEQGYTKRIRRAMGFFPLKFRNIPKLTQWPSHLYWISYFRFLHKRQKVNAPAPTALTIYVRTYMRRHTMIMESVVNVIPTAAMVGALVSAFGLMVL